MKAITMIIVLLAGVIAAAQSNTDEGAIRKILDDEITTWNQGDTDGYAKHFAADGTLTNVMGMFFTGRQAFRDRHEIIFKGAFRGTMLQLQVVSLRFLTPDVAVCETLTWVSDFKSGAPPGLHLDAKGRLRTRLLQVMAKRSGEWQIVVYHNVDIKPDVEAPEPEIGQENAVRSVREELHRRARHPILSSLGGNALGKISAAVCGTVTCAIGGSRAILP